MHLRSSLAIALTLAAVSATASARAQLGPRARPPIQRAEPTAVPPKPTPSKATAKADEALAKKIEERDRVKLHPGGALEIVGAEQGANEFRSRTPALESSERTVVHVDREELRARKLAMYGQDRSYDAPLSAVTLTEEGEAVREPVARAQQPALPAPRSNQLVWLIAGAAALALATLAPRISWRWSTRAATARH